MMLNGDKLYSISNNRSNRLFPILVYFIPFRYYLTKSFPRELHPMQLSRPKFLETTRVFPTLETYPFLYVYMLFLLPLLYPRIPWRQQRKGFIYRLGTSAKHRSFGTKFYRIARTGECFVSMIYFYS